MPSLSKELRGLLERTIAGENGARQIAEAGAEQSLQRLAVDRHEPHGSLTPEERTLRNQLRAHGRQLGDKLDPQRGGQTINHLKQAVAYEHWHRLLFARFLAENDLLMHPEHGVALSLDEVKELALGSGRDWIDLAAEYAQRMLLREVFRSDDPALRVPLSPEKRRDLEAKLNSLPREIFLADDSLGWVYQFWQKDAKEAVNLSEVKIGADELSPVTQLFTEDYMVLFLLENTLGAWWTARRGSPDLSGYTWTYLRLNGDGTPAAGTFDGWPKSVKELKVLDPCMGSGHFLTFALPILARMRETEEGLSLPSAISAVLRDNLFGLELDARCSQIAAFNLALTAWKMADRHFELPPLNLACSGLGINSKEADWTALAGNDHRAQETLRKLYQLFSEAPTLGSLIDPRRLASSLFLAEFGEVRQLFEAAIASEGSSDEVRELAIAASGVVASAQLLSSSFTLVCTNVPYLGRGNHSDTLAQFGDEYASDAAADLATLMLHRGLSFLRPGGTFSFVLPQNWWVGASYSSFRKRILQSVKFQFAVVLGEEAWRTFGNRGPNTILLIAELGSPPHSHRFASIDVSTRPGDTVVGLETKAALLRGESVTELSMTPRAQEIDQTALSQTKPYRISIGEIVSGARLSDFVESGEGCSTGDSDQFIRCFWEVVPSDEWLTYCGPGFPEWRHCDSSLVVYWQNGKGALAISDKARMQNMQLWSRTGVLVGRVRGITASLFNGGCYSKGAVLICPRSKSDLPALYEFLKSADFERYVRAVDPRVSAATSVLTDVPFEVSRWRARAEEAFPAGLPNPQSCNPTQSTSDGRIDNSDTPLQVAVARLVGYLWPRQTCPSFPDSSWLASDGLEEFSAKDGIVCLSSVAGEENAGTRLRALLQNAFGADYNLPSLLAGKKSATLEDWLRDEFFAEHCTIFQNGQGPRPFVWHIWDGIKDGFHALVNYQKLDHRNLEKLIFSYLGDWLTRQRQDVQNGVEGAETRLAAAEHLQGELKRILEGQQPYDIFVRWKPLDKQPIGWEPDLNDGVRMNIRPWITEAKLYRATKPGILRLTPNIKFTKDRGKESARDPKEFPWFAKSADRINDAHLSLEEKRRARGLQ